MEKRARNGLEGGLRRFGSLEVAHLGPPKRMERIKDNRRIQSFTSVP